MRKSVLLGGLGLIGGLLLVGVGLFWTGATPQAVRAHAAMGLLTGTPTAIGTATPTVNASPTACFIYFVDVPPDNTFYNYVRCLSCRGIVGGYACGGPGEPCPGQYFRPGNNVTRGQMSKIVTLAAGMADPIPSTQQTFEDVPPSGTFWLYIEQLAGRGIIGGYACGGPFEPCVGPGNRAYFRPNNEVTRGQLSKIVSGAAGYTGTPTGQTFEDVPPTSTFYLWVERLAGHGVIGGYACGGTGEPCVGPGNRAYFRPNAQATRGQLSKIAASAFTLAWSIVSSPNGGTNGGGLGGVAVVNASDIWAVGSYSNGSASQTLVEHWNGTGWSIIPSPNPGTTSNTLYSVMEVSANDVWAVGYYGNGGPNQTLTMHWDGLTWSIVSSPNAGSSENRLFDVAKGGSADIWAVGFFLNGGSHQTLVEHWNGMSWSIISSPNIGVSYNILNSVAVVNTSDVWAVGFATSGRNTHTLVEHWNGTNWSVMPSPNIGASDNELRSVAVVSTSDIWAVGYSFDGIEALTLVEHWNGMSWSVVPSPNIGFDNNSLASVVMDSASDGWAVGYSYNAASYQTLIEHWNGTSWRVVSSSNFGTNGDSLSSVAMVSANDVWAVGGYFDPNTDGGTLVEHYAPICP